MKIVNEMGWRKRKRTVLLHQHNPTHLQQDMFKNPFSYNSLTKKKWHHLGENSYHNSNLRHFKSHFKINLITFIQEANCFRWLQFKLKAHLGLIRLWVKCDLANNAKKAQGEIYQITKMSGLLGDCSLNQINVKLKKGPDNFFQGT